MTQKHFNQELLNFLKASPTSFHAVEQMKQCLQAADFKELKECDSWQLEPSGRYFVIRNQSSLIAFIQGQHNIVDSGLRMAGAHTDSPCLKVKPKPEIHQQGYHQLAVEVYGGVLMNPWFDRDLSLAGRVNYIDSENTLQNTLLDFQKPVAIIPSLAIHLNRDANNEKKVNPQKELSPILCQQLAADSLESEALVNNDNSEKKWSFKSLLKDQLTQQGLDVDQVMDYELMFYDTQEPAVIGLQDEFIASARLDNLLSCYVIMQALLNADDKLTTLIVCNDHEEVGSLSTSGANGPFLKSVLERLTGSGENLSRTMDLSFMISADNAHGIHPNYADKHDGNHQPKLNKGPVIKINANQRYASNSDSCSVFRFLCKQTGVAAQDFVMRNDLACGSTIGPITAGEIGAKTIDVGVPTFAMHSIREMAGSKDAYDLMLVIQEFFVREKLDR